MLGFEIYDSGMILSILIAFSAGILSFISPCILPIVPPYLAFISGVSYDQLQSQAVSRKRILYTASLFVLGLSVVFLFLGFTASSLGQLFLRNQILFGQIAGIVIIIFGLHFLGIIRIGLLNREFRVNADYFGGHTFGAFVLGLAFALGWVPCIGPQLGVILALAAQEESVAKGTFLLGVYAMGLGLPFLISAVFVTHFLQLSNRFKKHLPIVEKIIGVILVTIGLLMLTNQLTVISFWLIETIPFLAQIG
ncbi:MAG: cytochrome c biogenesis protein CcdA [Rhodobacteraceae bacterium]|nr:cytochrome c biogenesis protein CcdA [Paracoccaceae bacterium]